MSSVTFVLCGRGNIPMGGFRIVYEYANRLAERGWRVAVVHPAALATCRPFLKRFRAVPGYFRVKITGGHLPRSWFRVSPKVDMRWTPSMDEKHLPDADYIVACPIQVAHFVNSYTARKGKKFYFIQGFEDWVVDRKEVERTWKLPMRKIVIAKWLLDIAQGLGESAVYIPNGMDFSFFKVCVPQEKREPHSVLFMAHTQTLKGTRYAVDALSTLRQKYPALIVRSFGVHARPEGMPDNVEYFQNPSQEELRDLYNKSVVFISPSLVEGWPLPPAEAMLCGCVVVATDIGGHREYVVDGSNGFLCKLEDPQSIADRIAYLLDNPQVARNVSLSAPDSLRKFDWDSRVDLFEMALQGQ